MELIALQEPELESVPPPDVEIDAALRSQIWGVLGLMYPYDVLERRSQDRFAYPKLLRITPVSGDGSQAVEPTFVVAGKHLSERGLGFFHPGPLPHRAVVVSLERPGGQWVHLLLNLKWCRFVSHGWYESGGWFVRSVPAPGQG
jgi:hypothetical protein